MGTNVYMCKIPTQAELDVIKEKIDKLDFRDAIYAIEDLKNQSEIHIGKRSAGWKFLFAENPRYYEETKESILKFLHSPGYILKTEYGEKINPDEFWDEYVEAFKDGLDGQTYKFYDREHITSEGLRFTIGNFA